MKSIEMFFVFVLLFFSAFSCAPKKASNVARLYTVGEKYYFKEVDLKQGPNFLQGSIPKEQVARHAQYFEVVFNRRQLVRSLSFIFSGNVIWKAEYTYHDNGVVKSEVWTEDGDTRTRYFSENGKLLRGEN
ncbi:MAG: hypothetical protein IH624_08480 [Phycisphaerae bacterium]|nr:hypothetical protein [Phycisphaerae bacterium]